MQIYQTIYSSYKPSRYNNLQKNEPNFCAKERITSPEDSSIKDPINGLTSIAEIAAGEFGTVCKGSLPLGNFFREMDIRKFLIIMYRGLSTNDTGGAYSFLKSSADNPISTSFVQDCSVMYLYNKADNTHFMYHIHRDVKRKELDFLIKHFMPNGYTNAAIVPGNVHFKSTHERYLSDVFEAIRTNNPNAKINIYHFSSKSPEIVGYKGMVYEIPNKAISEQIKNGTNPYFIRDLPQVSFKIQDIRVSPDLYKLSCCNDLESVNEMKQKIKKSKYDSEIKQVFYDILDARLADIQRIENCSNMEELDRLAKDLYDNDIQSYFAWAYKGYENIICAKRNSLKKM